MAEGGQLLVLALDRQDPCTPPSGIVHSLQQSRPGRCLGRDDQNGLVTARGREVIDRARKVRRRRCRYLPAEKCGVKVLAAEPFGVVTKVGGEVPRLLVGRAHHEESNRGLRTPAETDGEAPSPQAQIAGTSRPAAHRAAGRVHACSSASSTCRLSHILGVGGFGATKPQLSR